MEKQDYRATRDVWVYGNLVREGETIRLSERAAKYHLLDGALKPIQQAVEAPKKRAKKGDAES